MFLAICTALVFSLLLPSRVSLAAASPSSSTCTIDGDVITGQLGHPLPAFVRFSTRDGKFREILSLPAEQPGFHNTYGSLRAQSLLPLGGVKTDLGCSAADPPDGYDNVSLSGEPCDYRNYTVVDNGPAAIFAGAARGDQGAIVRVRVAQEKFFASGTETLDDWVGFSVDEGPLVALPAKGIEPVLVTAYFPNIKPGPHRIEISTFEGFEASAIDNSGAPQGTICL